MSSATAVPAPSVVGVAVGGAPRHEPHRWLTLAVLCTSLLIVSLDNTILNVALPVLVRDMHATSTQLQWIVDAYAVVFAGLMLAIGSLGDRIGRKWVFVAGLALFAAGSAASAFSGSPDRLIATRAFMGVGAAAVMPSTLSILINVFTDDGERARAIGIWSGTSGLGVAVGPVAGGWLLAHYWWGSIFLVNVPIALAGVAAATVLVPNSRNPRTRKPDPAGALLSIVGMGLLLWGIIEAPSRSWSSPLVVGGIVGGLAVLGAFVAWERHSSHPMLELSFFRSRRFSVAMTCMGLVLFGLMGSLFLLTQYLQFSLGYSALATGVRIAPMAAVVLVAAPISMMVVRRVGTTPVVFFGMACIATGLALLSRTTVHGTYGDALPAFFLVGTGVGFAFAPLTDSITGSLPLERAGVGSATNGASLQLGGALGVGVLGSILNTRYEDRLTPVLAAHHAPASVSHLVTGSLGGALSVAQHLGGALGAGLAEVARAAFVSGAGLALAVGAVVVGTAALGVSALLPRRPDVDRSPVHDAERTDDSPSLGPVIRS